MARVGDAVRGRFRDGRWYGAVVARVRGDGMYELDWDDGDDEDRVKGGGEMRAGKREVGREGKGVSKRARSDGLGGGVGGGYEDGTREDVCGVCMGAPTTHRLIPCGHRVGFCSCLCVVLGAFG